MKMSAIADRASAVLVFRGTLWNRHFELMLALLTFVFPRVSFKYISAGVQGHPGRSFHNIKTAARRAFYLLTWRKTIRDGMVEHIQTLLA
jgi:hypothetical protein